MMNVEVRFSLHCTNDVQSWNTLNDEFNQSYYGERFGSEVCVGSLYSTIFEITTKNCTEMIKVMRMASHFQLIHIMRRIRW